MKITNQVIRSCKRYITENGNLTIWAQVRSLESIFDQSKLVVADVDVGVEDGLGDSLETADNLATA